MINNVEDEKIVLEIRELIRGVDTVKDEINVYCDLMRQMFLAGSGKN